jgi:hypothetical protein
VKAFFAAIARAFARAFSVVIEKVWDGTNWVTRKVVSIPLAFAAAFGGGLAPDGAHDAAATQAQETASGLWADAERKVAERRERTTRAAEERAMDVADLAQRKAQAILAEHEGPDTSALPWAHRIWVESMTSEAARFVATASKETILAHAAGDAHAVGFHPLPTAQEVADIGRGYDSVEAELEVVGLKVG